MKNQSFSYLRSLKYIFLKIWEIPQEKDSTNVVASKYLLNFLMCQGQT